MFFMIINGNASFFNGNGEIKLTYITNSDADNERMWGLPVYADDSCFIHVIIVALCTLFVQQWPTLHDLTIKQSDEDYFQT
mgnify:CR=1 FL=1